MRMLEKKNSTHPEISKDKGIETLKGINEKIDDNTYLEKALGATLGKTNGSIELAEYTKEAKEYLFEDTEKEELVPLSISIVGNRHFKKRDIGLGVSDEYVYVTEEGEILPASNRFQAYDMLAMISY